MSKILARLWAGGEATNIKVAYAIAVCQYMLSKNYERLTISEVYIKSKIIKNLVIILNILINKILIIVEIINNI